LAFFLSTFLGVSRQGEFKNTIKIFWQKVRVENFPQNFDKNFDVSFSSTTFVLSHFRVFFSDGSSKTPQKTFYKKNRHADRGLGTRVLISQSSGRCFREELLRLPENFGHVLALLFGRRSPCFSIQATLSKFSD
jgi:hypothetical protein